MGNLQDKVAIVTGSTEGIGYAAALGLAAAGAHVVVTGRTRQRVDASLLALKAALPKASAQGIAVDLAGADGCAALVRSVPRADILVNNVGIFEPKPFFEVPDEDWERFFQTNVMSGVRLARAYMQDMLARNWGRVVFVSSESGLNIPVQMIHYGVTKTAMLGVSRGLAKLAAGTGVTVNAVLPGPTRTAGVEAMLQGAADRTGKSIDELGKEFVMEHRPSSLIRRLASAEEVANMIVYVCSPEASATTGAALRVDGGTVDSIV